MKLWSRKNLSLQSMFVTYEQFIFLLSFGLCGTLKRVDSSVGHSVEFRGPEIF